MAGRIQSGGGPADGVRENARKTRAVFASVVALENWPKRRERQNYGSHADSQERIYIIPTAQSSSPSPLKKKDEFRHREHVSGKPKELPFLATPPAPKLREGRK
jgi:hypothetical protein